MKNSSGVAGLTRLQKGGGMTINKCGCGGEATVQEHKGHNWSGCVLYEYVQLYIVCNECGTQTMKTDTTLLNEYGTMTKERLEKQLALIWNKAHPDIAEMESNITNLREWRNMLVDINADLYKALELCIESLHTAVTTEHPECFKFNEDSLKVEHWIKLAREMKADKGAVE